MPRFIISAPAISSLCMLVAWRCDFASMMLCSFCCSFKWMPSVLIPRHVFHLPSPFFSLGWGCLLLGLPLARGHHSGCSGGGCGAAGVVVGGGCECWCGLISCTQRLLPTPPYLPNTPACPAAAVCPGGHTALCCCVQRSLAQAPPCPRHNARSCPVHGLQTVTWGADGRGCDVVGCRGGIVHTFLYTSLFHGYRCIHCAGLCCIRPLLHAFHPGLLEAHAW
mmetsp:Transcript_16270/g.40483  ORF Transcript_16270/g.40483 Transcript_16270/m.40483 type:complete len:222 (-) Transcript_16270:910-1575(-)